MSMKVAPAGTSPLDKDKWTAIGTTDRATFDFSADTETLDFFGGYRATRTTGQRRSVVIDFADGRRMYIPHADVRIEAGKPGSLIVDGAITADRIRAGSIPADKIAAKTIPLQKLRIWAEPERECAITLPFPSKVKRSQAIINEIARTFYGAYPQRFVLGLPAPTTTEESPMTARTFTNNIRATITVDSNGVYPMVKINPQYGTSTVVLDKDLPALANELFAQSVTFNDKIQRTVTQDGKPSVKVGDGGTAGIVYKPTTEDQAKRNLNFALANLAAYVEWDEVGRKRAEELEAKKQEALEALRKRAKELEEAEARRSAQAAKERRKRDDALRFYNKVNGTNYGYWSSLYSVSEGTIQSWINLSEATKGLQNPFATGAVYNNQIIGTRRPTSWL